MVSFAARQLLKPMSGKWIKGDQNTVISGFINKASKVKPGYMFFDVKGGKTGQRNISRAIENGAAAVVVAEKNYEQQLFEDDGVPAAVITVDDVWEAFWSVVKLFRELHHIPVVGVTGSSGKTTTTHMIASIFSRRWKIYKTKRNLNLPEYLPAQIMRLQNGYEAAVFEIGMHRRGQVGRQSSIIQPEVAVITNIGPAHVEYLGNLEQIILEKSDIIKGMPGHGCLVLNADNPATKKIDLSDFKGKIVYFGLKNKADYTASEILIKGRGTYFRASVDGKKHYFFIPVYGRHNVYNALAAIAAARYYNFDIETIKAGLAGFSQPKMRLQILPGLRESVLIDDTYNANPDSIIAGLEVLKELSRKKISVAVLGDMLEQGEYALENHRKVGRKVEELKINWLITVGELAREIAGAIKSSKIKKWSFDNTWEAASFLRKALPGKSVVLVKGSRGSRMERVVKAITERRESRQ